jgi:transcriptional regulator with XRE-family HTH domain
MASTQTTRVHKSFARWVKDSGLSQREIARQLDSSPAFISDIVLGKGWPGRALANAIERATETWAKGPIKSEEWDEAEKRLSRRVA